jgi:hypothetical protein
LNNLCYFYYYFTLLFDDFDFFNVYTITIHFCMCIGTINSVEKIQSTVFFITWSKMKFKLNCVALVARPELERLYDFTDT